MWQNVTKLSMKKGGNDMPIKTILIAIAVVIALGGTVFGALRYVRTAERSEITIELQENQNERRKKINESLHLAPNNVNDSLQYLLDRSN